MNCLICPSRKGSGEKAHGFSLWPLKSMGVSIFPFSSALPILLFLRIEHVVNKIPYLALLYFSDKGQGPASFTLAQILMPSSDLFTEYTFSSIFDSPTPIHDSIGDKGFKNISVQ